MVMLMMTKKVLVAQPHHTPLLRTLATSTLNLACSATFFIKAFMHISFLFHKFTQAFCSFASFRSFFFLFGCFFVVAHCCTPKVCSSFLFHKFAQAFYELHNFHRLLCYSTYCTCVQDYSPFKLSSPFWFVFFCSIVACNGNATIVTNCLSSNCFTVIRVIFCEL